MKHNTKQPETHSPDENHLRRLIERHESEHLPRLEKLWNYYRNELTLLSPDGPDRFGPQHAGLPERIRRPSGPAREIVIENDIAWRIHTMVDFMFGKPVTIQSQAADPATADRIEAALHSVFEANGGITFFQNLALLGSIYGFVDVIVRPHASTSGMARRFRAPSKPITSLTLETVEAPRAIPVVDASDYRRLNAYAVHYARELPHAAPPTFLQRLRSPSLASHRVPMQQVTEFFTADRYALRLDGKPAHDLPHGLGELPVVHIQNLPQPLSYAGLSEVEPLITLQDELNIRLSDRANRVTLQSFKMYLGKGIENFQERPVGPGQMWMTDNVEAAIESFGGDAASPSEDAHINEIREAIDKISGVTPLAAGILRNKVGNLTSENALRITLMGLLAKTQRKRVTYGMGIERLCRLILRVLDAQGELRTSEADRRVQLHWPSPLPENSLQRLREAQMKLDIGVPRQQVLAELGYSIAHSDSHE